MKLPSLAAIQLCTAFILSTFFLTGCSTPSSATHSIVWAELPALPPVPSQEKQPGLAGALIGVSHNALLVAGGSNFPEKPVWEKGPKYYYDDVYVLLPDMEWRIGTKLPRKLGYSTTLMFNNRTICIGGHDGKSTLRDVFSMEWNEETKTIDFETFPSLPVPIKSAAGAVISNTLYLVGGEMQISEGGHTVKKACNTLYYLDMDHIQDGWQAGPSFPGPARKKLLAAAQQTSDGDCLFIFSGMSFPLENSEPDVMTDGLRYNPRTQQWTKIAPIAPKGLSPRAVCSGTAIATGENQILVFGGRGSQNLASILKTVRKKGEAKKSGDTAVFNRCEQILSDYFTQTVFRYNELILLYNTITDRWSSLGTYPAPPVTGSKAVWWNNRIVIPSGETQPGVRTPVVMSGAIQKGQ